ncbi:MAG: hypothetical protein NZM26_05280 [Patescibacteria group bacterium]|nr:hypothetical protein [Patescibacteria group bacterium]
MQNVMGPDSEPPPNQNVKNENSLAQGQKAEDANRQQEIMQSHPGKADNMNQKVSKQQIIQKLFHHYSKGICLTQKK